MKTSYPLWFYPKRDENCLTGEPACAPTGLPVVEVSRATIGRGRNKVTRVMIRTAAPAGWGEWSGREWHAYADADALCPVMEVRP